MPRGSGTGPAGMGPLTGRGMGYCAGYDRPGFANAGPGYGTGMRYGRGYRGGGGGGWGWRNMYYATGLPGWARYGYGPAGAGYAVPPVPAAPQWTAENEAAALRQQAEALENSLSAIKQRLDELSQGSEEE